MPYPHYWRPWITPKEKSKELVTPDLDLKVVGMDNEVLATESLTTETQEQQHIHEFGEEFEQASSEEKLDQVELGQVELEQVELEQVELEQVELEQEELEKELEPKQERQQTTHWNEYTDDENEDSDSPIEENVNEEDFQGTLENSMILSRKRGEPGQTNESNHKRNVGLCTVCYGSHYAFYCLKDKNPKQVERIARRKKLCFNCLSNQHETKGCPSESRCTKCDKKHSHLLHKDFPQQQQKQQHHVQQGAQHGLLQKQYEQHKQQVQVQQVHTQQVQGVAIGAANQVGVKDAGGGQGLGSMPPPQAFMQPLMYQQQPVWLQQQQHEQYLQQQQLVQQQQQVLPQQQLMLQQQVEILTHQLRQQQVLIQQQQQELQFLRPNHHLIEPPRDGGGQSSEPNIGTSEYHFQEKFERFLKKNKSLEENLQSYIQTMDIKDLEKAIREFQSQPGRFQFAIEVLRTKLGSMTIPSQLTIEDSNIDNVRMENQEGSQESSAMCKALQRMREKRAAKITTVERPNLEASPTEGPSGSPTIP